MTSTQAAGILVSKLSGVTSRTNQPTTLALLHSCFYFHKKTSFHMNLVSWPRTKSPHYLSYHSFPWSNIIEHQNRQDNSNRSTSCTSHCAPISTQIDFFSQKHQHYWQNLTQSTKLYTHVLSSPPPSPSPPIQPSTPLALIVVFLAVWTIWRQFQHCTPSDIPGIYSTLERSDGGKTDISETRNCTAEKTSPSCRVLPYRWGTWGGGLDKHWNQTRHPIHTGAWAHLPAVHTGCPSC